MRNWIIDCMCNNLAGGMDSEEDHHPGRLAGPTERIPKLVHDIIHQDERDAVKGVFKLDGITGFNPGRWTGKNISEETSVPHLLNFDSFKFVEEFRKNMEESRKREEEIKEEKQRRAIQLQENIKMLTGFSLNRNEERNNTFLSNNQKFEWEDFSSLPKRNFAVNVPSYSETYISTLPSFQPAFCLGGSMDHEAMERRETWRQMDHFIKTAPNGYGGGPVLYTPSDGWQPV